MHVCVSVCAKCSCVPEVNVSTFVCVGERQCVLQCVAVCCSVLQCVAV